MQEAHKPTFTEGEFYQVHFNSRVYIDSFYSNPDGHPDENDVPFSLWSLSKTFSSGKHSGQRLIDIGTGPSIHSLISASEHYEDILVSDYTDSNRQEIKKWLNDEEGCFDWLPVIQYVCNLGGERTPSQVAQQLRQRVKQVLKCDVRLENPFHPVTVEPADCIVTSLCLEAACKDLETYCCSLRNIASLLRPGGLLVMVGVLGETYYVVGGQRFSCLDLSQATVEGILKELGFSVTEFNVQSAPNRENDTVSDYSAVFHLMAVKSSKKVCIC
ncbi:nicotinamide N-methyltransferase [Osmerus mordax]|uniref:nicotinamide N-methyltransferase n=1 Tax=Osmerus mordax TaxID=8014 RepID=UPI003510A132